MIHGKKDEVVPGSLSKEVLKIFNKAKKKLVLVGNGDHSLSNKNHLNNSQKAIFLFLNSKTFLYTHLTY